MAGLGPVSRRTFIEKFRAMGFEGPAGGADHAFMERGTTVVKVPNPHRGDISVDLLRRILANAGISREEWMDA